jgi:hypothetical protein
LEGGDETNYTVTPADLLLHPRSPHKRKASSKKKAGSTSNKKSGEAKKSKVGTSKGGKGKGGKAGGKGEAASTDKDRGTCKSGGKRTVDDLDASSDNKPLVVVQAEKSGQGDPSITGPIADFVLLTNRVCMYIWAVC